MDKLEDLLQILGKYGLPVLRKMQGGWYCTIDMFAVPAGCSITFRSKFDEMTPMAATLAVFEHIKAAYGNAPISLDPAPI